MRAAFVSAPAAALVVAVVALVALGAVALGAAPVHAAREGLARDADDTPRVRIFNGVAPASAAALATGREAVARELLARHAAELKLPLDVAQSQGDPRATAGSCSTPCTTAAAAASS